MLQFKIKEFWAKNIKVSLALMICFIFLFFKIHENIKNYTGNKNIIKICQNKQYFENEIAIWTLLTDDIYNYGLGAI